MKFKAQNGNVLFIILIAVGLFAALGYAVSSSMQGGGKGITAEQAQLRATELLAYANTLSTSVSQLRLRGCSDTEISFENALVGGYENANAPDDKTCHVFQPAGGGVRFSHPDDGINDGSGSLSTWFFDGRLVIADAGYCSDQSDESCKDLKVLLRVNDQICNEINKKMLGSIKDLAFTADEALTTEKFTGSYSTDDGILCGNTSPMRNWCANKQTYCGLFTAGNTGGDAPHYTLVHRLIAR